MPDSISNKLKDLREIRVSPGGGAYLTQQELADLVPMSRDRLLRIENETSFATPAERRQLAGALSKVPTKQLGRVKVTVEELGLRVDPLGATRGRRRKTKPAADDEDGAGTWIGGVT